MGKPKGDPDTIKAAELMGVSPQFVRIGIQRGILPIGKAVKMKEGGSRYTYYISPKLFKDFTGIDFEAKG